MKKWVLTLEIIDAIKNRRSIRKFLQKPIAEEVLIDLIDCARLAPYPANIQPLKFVIVNRSKTLDEIFACTKWAGYLDNGAPSKNDRPMAYVVVLGDTYIKKNRDFRCEMGIAGSHIVIGATDYGIASCWLGALKREKIASILSLPDNLIVLDIIALGYANQRSVPVDMIADVWYYLDANEVINVPKRSLENVIVKIM